MTKQWYVVHTYSGFENKVKANIEERVGSLGMKDKFGQILIPTENVVELKEGKKKVAVKKVFPGYILVEMEMSDETWTLVKNIPKVTGFVGGGSAPSPLAEKEVETIIQQMDASVATPRSRVQFNRGDAVRIVAEPFLGFNGVVDDVDSDHGKVKVLVSIFGRATPVELDFLQVEKL
ncbi:MAG: transcription termination/antitermination protein NusG [Nitrospirota bacterium]|nr:transcription termination/antitermination protein NusG [Nitrospirota bacterium]